MLDWGKTHNSCWSLQAFIGVTLDGGTSSWRTDRGKEDNLKPGGWADITWHLAGNSSIERAAFTEIGNKSFEAWTECDIFTLCTDVNWRVAGNSVTERDALSETVNKLSSDWTEHNVFTLRTRSFWQVPLWGLATMLMPLVLTLSWGSQADMLDMWPGHLKRTPSQLTQGWSPSHFSQQWW